MPSTKPIKVADLKLDLKNFRTTPQKSESAAVRAMISINPGMFWALMESLLRDGYHPTENIIVLTDAKGNLVVREGNRRIAALKLILGLTKRAQFDLPQDIDTQIANVDAAWISSNSQVPCATYLAKESATVDRIVALTHGKGELAGRDKWNAVARARHNRDAKAATEPALDLLEKYLEGGKNLSSTQRERWSGEFPLSVLDEAIKKLAPKVGAKTGKEFVAEYPSKTKHRSGIERLIYDIGTETLGFKHIRSDTEDWASSKYGFPPQSKSGSGTSSGKSGAGSTANASTAKSSNAPKTKRATATNDPKTVARALKAFVPKGANREKLVLLLDEARRLSLIKHPHAFCFVLRSMFEISAKAYCIDHQAKAGPAATKADGTDRSLVDVLRDITSHLTKKKTDKQMTKLLHGPMAELARPEGFLSVTSMNQLVHNPRFSIDETHIATLFGNIFPLLEEMNR